jgi:L-ascorbate metabolism protein UlaG (beta-lactamase superfamily)
MGKLRVYAAGDTEDIPEMRTLTGIDIAFLPMNQPYTMTPAQVASAAKAFKPKVLYPYHFGGTPTREIEVLLKDEPAIEVRIRALA